MTRVADAVEAEMSLSASEDELAPQEVTPELLAALVKQVEFYFSDANLPSDKKLLKQIRKDADGYVPVKLFANFRKVRALSKDVPVITEALRSTTLLQLSADAKRVRRLVPVPEYDISDIQRRTIVVENLPGDPSPTIESVTEMFRTYGRVKLVRICSRESKGKLPSWLTSSVQNMAGQHAYIEFEEEEGAVLAAAALAQDYDAPDGAAQVRRLTACIAEQRERRSGHGGGSSFGGSSGGSRKGSRDVSPLGSRAGCSRRNSNGGGSYGGTSAASYGGNSAASYGGSSVSCGGASSWTSAGGAPEHHYSYGGSYEHPYGSNGGGMPTRRSGGGAPPHCSFPPPPPPPPARRSCDSAPPMEAPPLPQPAAPPAALPRLNIYRPPGKRLSDGSQSGSQAPSPTLPRTFASPSGPQGPAASFASSTPASAAGTPTATAPPSPPLPSAPSAAASPPLATRAPIFTVAPHPAAPAAGKPPVHPPLAPHQATSALAEAIAHAQAERRASEAGYRAATAQEVAVAPLSTSAGGMAPVAPVTVAHVPRPASVAPKFCFDPAAGLPSSRRMSAPAASALLDSGEQLVGSAGSSGSGALSHAPKLVSGAAAAKTASAAVSVASGALPRGAQMVADVEGFINNILARPTTRSTPAAPSAGAQQQQPRRPVPTSMAPRPVDAAAAVADILATTLRRTSSTDVSKVAAPAAAAAKLPAAIAVIATAPAPVPDVKASVAAAPAVPPPAPAVRPMVYITAIAAGEDEDHAALLAHAVTVTVHRGPGGAAMDKPGKQQHYQQAEAQLPRVMLGGSSPAGRSISPRDSPAEPQQVSSGSGGKRFSRREYAQWAAATPGFRAEASLKFAAGAPVQQRSSGGGAGPTVCYAPASFSDGGAGPAAHGPNGASWHVARGPDGSRGFSGRGSWVSA